MGQLSWLMGQWFARCDAPQLHRQGGRGERPERGWWLVRLLLLASLRSATALKLECMRTYADPTSKAATTAYKRLSYFRRSYM